MKKIAIIGHFGGKEEIANGQIVKTKILYDELSKVTDFKINKIDTYLKKKHPIWLLIKILCALLTTRKIIVLLSENGRKWIFPLLSFAARRLKTEVFHDVIGGNLDKYILDNERFRMYLNSFTVNWVETKGLMKRLEDLGVKNCEVLPNFKRLRIVNRGEMRIEYSEPYRFCTFSRVMKEKGIEEAIEAIQQINKQVGYIKCKLDIYGLIDPEYEKAFQDKINSTEGIIQYCGVIDYSKSVETIENYYALLFPTKWKGEGCPGTIVDAFSAGLPVIATDWNSNGEIIENKKTGIIYPNEELETLRDSILWIILHKKEHIQMKLECIESARKYQPEQYVGMIKTKMQI